MHSISVELQDLIKALDILSNCKHAYIRLVSDNVGSYVKPELFIYGQYEAGAALRVKVLGKLSVVMPTGALWVDVQQMRATLKALDGGLVALKVQYSDLHHARALVFQDTETEIIEPVALRDENAIKQGEALVRMRDFDAASLPSSTDIGKSTLFKMNTSDFLQVCKVFHATAKQPYPVLQNALLVLGRTMKNTRIVDYVTAYATNGVSYAQNVAPVVISEITGTVTCLVRSEFCSALRALNAPTINFATNPTAFVAHAHKRNVQVSAVQRTSADEKLRFPDTKVIRDYVSQVPATATVTVPAGVFDNALKQHRDPYVLVEFGNNTVQLTFVRALPEALTDAQCIVQTQALRQAG